MIMTDGYKKLDLEEKEVDLVSEIAVCEIDAEEFKRIKEQKKSIKY